MCNRSPILRRRRASASSSGTPTAPCSTPIRATRAVSTCSTAPITTWIYCQRGAMKPACLSTPSGCAVTTNMTTELFEDRAMDYRESSDKLKAYREQIRQLREQMRAVQCAVEPEQVQNYMFRRVGDTV